MALENTDKAISELLLTLPDIIKGASGQLPDIASQMLIIGMYDAYVGIVIGGVLLVIALLFGLKACFGHEEIGCGFFASIFLIISFLLLGHNITQSYKIEHAPKVYLLEQAKQYIK